MSAKSDNETTAQARRQALLGSAKLGNALALGELLDSFRPYLAAIARARRAGRAASKFGESDLTQDTLLNAHRNFGSFRGTTVEEFAGWLRQIAIHATDHALREQLDVAKRDASREVPLAGLSDLVHGDSSTPSRRAIRNERSAQLAEALARLPDDMQTVIVGRHFDNVSYADLAKRLDRSEAAVRVLYTRALRRLRETCRVW